MASPTPIVTGEHVILAHIRREDIPVIAPYFASLELSSYLGRFGASHTLQDEEAWFEGISRSREDRVLFGIFAWDTEELVGGIDLRDINHRNGTALLGVSVYSPEHWGSGYGSEAVRLMVEYGVFFLNLHNIMLNVFSYNTWAIRAYEKAGFREIGRRRGTVRLGHERFDDVLMDITADEVDTSRMRSLVRLLPPPAAE